MTPHWVPWVRLQVELEPPQEMVGTDAELLVAVLEQHLVRMLRVAPHLQMLDFTTFAIQARALRTRHLPRRRGILFLRYDMHLGATQKCWLHHLRHPSQAATAEAQRHMVSKTDMKLRTTRTCLALISSPSGYGPAAPATPRHGTLICWWVSAIDL